MRTKFLILFTNLILVNASFVLAFLLRYGINLPKENFVPYKQNYLVITFIYFVCFMFARLFSKRFRSHWILFKSIFISCFVGAFFCLGFFYIFRTQFGGFPSSVFGLQFPLCIGLIFGIDTFLLRRMGRIVKKVAIIGKGEPLEILEKSKRIEKIYVDQIEDLLHHDDIDEVVILERIHDDKQLNFLIYLLMKLKVNVVFGPAIYAELLGENVMEENDLRYLATFIGRKSDTEEFLMRSLDVVGSVAMVIVFFPLMLFVSILVKISSKGPVIFSQQRVTKDGQPFMLYKFRTMVQDAEKLSGPVWASQDDPRVTRIGRFLRDTRLDEIPQLINVLFGHMSLVGPRPERPHFIKIHKHLRETRLAVKPGLTGFAQIRNLYDLHPKHKIKYDYLYIQRRSLLLNLYILIMTIPVMISRKGQ